MKETEQCDCMMWARDGSDILHSNHHKNCKYRDIEKEASEHLKKILMALEYEGSQGDGINDQFLEDYERAKFFVGWIK